MENKPGSATVEGQLEWEVGIVNEAPQNLSRELEMLEGQLRDLQPPAPSEHLVQRLLNDIPNIDRVKPRVHVAAVVTWATTIAVLLLIGSGTLL